MNKAEWILISIVALGFVMRLLHLPGANILMIVPLLILSCTYAYLGFALFNNIRFRSVLKKDSYNGIKANKIIGAIGAGFALSCCVLGIMFKFLSWPGASFMLGTGLITTLTVAIIALLKRKNDPSKYYTNILKRIAVFGTLCFILLVLPTKTWLQIQYLGNPEYVQAIMNARANPDNPELWLEVEKEWNKVTNGDDKD